MSDEKAPLREHRDDNSSSSVVERLSVSTAFFSQLLLFYLLTSIPRLIQYTIDWLYGLRYPSVSGVLGLTLDNLILVLFTTYFFWIFIVLGQHKFPQFVRRVLYLSDVPGAIPFHVLNDTVEKEVRYSNSEAMVFKRLRAIRVIDERINSFRVRSTWMLLSIGILLVAAAIIIIFAGSLTNLDVSAASDIDRITQDITRTETKLAQLSEISDLNKKLAEGQSKDVKDEAKKRLDFMRNSDASLPTEQSGINAEMNSTVTRLDQDEKLLKDAWTKQLNTEHGYSDTRYLIATAITRIGVVIIIVFLVQILIGLYRYNTLLLTFYNSQRDSLELSDGTPANIEKLHKVMAPNIQFGKEPKHPLEEIIRQVMSKIHIGRIPDKTG